MTDDTPPLAQTLVADLRAMGLVTGDPVLVRCATRPIAPRAKAVASTLLDALIEVVGPTGTVVALTFTALQSAKLKKVASAAPIPPTRSRRSARRRSSSPSATTNRRCPSHGCAA